MARSLEDSYDRVVADMGGQSLPVIKVYIHPDKGSFSKILGYRAQGSIIGVGEMHLVKLNLFAKCLISSGQLAIHEFAHCVMLNLLINNPGGSRYDQRYPRWLWESVACYEAGQSNAIWLFLSVCDGFPSLQRINSHNSKVYAMGYSIIDFIIQGWGKKALVDLILERGNISGVLKIENEVFEKNYHAFLKRKYFRWFPGFFQ